MISHHQGDFVHELTKGLNTAIEIHIKGKAEALKEKILNEFEKDIDEAIAKYIIETQSSMSFDRYGMDLRIHVKKKD